MHSGGLVFEGQRDLPGPGGIDRGRRLQSRADRVTEDLGKHVLILPGPKRGDLRRDGRYSLHTETFAPPREDDGFAVSGRATEVADRARRGIVRDQVLADFGALWPDFDELTLFELSVASCLLTLTQPDEAFPKGPTIWKA